MQSTCPSISAICRLGKFAPRLKVNDEVLYLTVKKSFGQKTESHYKVVAHLRVHVSFTSHAEAAAWYTASGVAIPSNCMVPGNPPIPYEQTNGRPGKEWQSYSDAEKLRRWDATYRFRARQVGSFHACESLWCELQQPPKLLTTDFVEILGRAPCTQTPPSFAVTKIRALLLRAQQNGV